MSCSNRMPRPLSLSRCMARCTICCGVILRNQSSATASALQVTSECVARKLSMASERDRPGILKKARPPSGHRSLPEQLQCRHQPRAPLVTAAIVLRQVDDPKYACQPNGLHCRCVAPDTGKHAPSGQLKNNWPAHTATPESRE